MERQFICAANWKLNKGPNEAQEFLSEFLEAISADSQSSYIIFPPAVTLTVFAEKLSGTKVNWGPQNVYSENSGAFTGENSAEMTKAMGATHGLVGHSERRSIFNEQDALLAEKVALLQAQRMVPVLCVGESLEERESGRTQNVVAEQLKQGLTKCDFSKDFLLAYEPVWAIGTGKVATPEQAEEVQAFLRGELAKIASADVANNTEILYGGSVKPDNAAELSKNENVDGFLIGGASLKVDSFVKIYENSQ